MPIHPRSHAQLARSITSLFIAACLAVFFAGAAFAAHHGDGDAKADGQQGKEQVCEGGPDGQCKHGDQCKHGGGQCKHGSCGKHGRSKGLKKALTGLDLSDDVRAQVDALIADAAKRREPIQNAMHATHEQLRGLMEAEVPDRSSILGHADQMGRLRTELDKIKLTTLLDVRALLDPQQREALDQALKKKGRGHHGKGKGKGKGKGHGDD